jgi:predicted small secreted protein
MESIIYKKTSFFLACMILVALCLTILASQNTFQLIGRYQDLQSSLEAVENIPIGKPLTGTQKIFQEIDLNAELFEVMSESARTHQVKIKSINSPFASTTSDFSVLTKEVVLEGGFISSLKCLDDATHRLKYVKLSSVKFERDLVAKSNTLYTRVYFQTIKKNDNNAQN